MSEYSGIILAGGDGTRLSALTRRLAGDDRPKQFRRPWCMACCASRIWRQRGPS
jgi:nucleotidyltransferase-like protein